MDSFVGAGQLAKATAAIDPPVQGFFKNPCSIILLRILREALWPLFSCPESREPNGSTPTPQTSRFDVWCEHETVQAKTYNGQPWTYLSIPHDLDDRTHEFVRPGDQVYP